jgi:mycothiol synthase
MLTIHVEQLDIPNMTERHWQDLLSARAEFGEESRPGEPGASHQEQRRFISQIPELQDEVAFWIFYDGAGRCVGYCTLAHPKPENPDYEANKDRVYIEPVVLARYRRQGVGTQLLAQFVDYAQKAGASWIQWDTKFESGLRFSEKIGASEAGRQRTNRLSLSDVDWDLMQRWVGEGQSRNPNTELMRFVYVPAPDLIKPFCELVSAINRLQPRDGLEGVNFTLTPAELERAAQRYRERHIEKIVFCTREDGNLLSGMTDISYNKDSPAHAHIALSGVRSEFQNRGLGKWLKAAMALDLRAQLPEVKYMNTDNFNNNGPILSINERMGFRLFEQYVFYKIKVPDLALKISSLC